MVIVLAGPGGVGKGTIAQRLIELDSRLVLSRSWTTRDRREGEAADAYVFVDVATFRAAVDEQRFLEWNHFIGKAYYGTPMPDAAHLSNAVEPGDSSPDLLLEIDVNGARQVREVVDDPLILFVDAPSRDEQQKRLLARGDQPDRVAARIEAADDERALAEELHAIIVINDDLDDTVAEIQGLIEDRRIR